MLLFADGFECFHITDLWRKWGAVDLDVEWNSTQKLYDESGAKIAFGSDTTVNPPQQKARHERSLAARDYALLGTPIKKSRTVFVGFALRSKHVVTVSAAFCTDVYPFRQSGPSKSLRSSVLGHSDGHEVAARCNFTVLSDRIEPVWSFAHWSLPSQYGQIYSNTDLLSGDWYYYQLGFTLFGSEVGNPQAWVENRIGNRAHKRWRQENIRTCIPGNNASFFINGVIFSFDVTSTQWFYLDDFYISNDEGEVNNEFLGNVAVRTVSPVSQGSINETQMVAGGDGLRDEKVNLGDEMFCNTYDSMPSPPPTHEENPELILWKDPLASYLRFNREEAKQLFLCSHINYAGAEPHIFGVAVTHISRTGKWGGLASQLMPMMKVGESQIVGRDSIAPATCFVWNVASHAYPDQSLGALCSPVYGQANEDGSKYYRYSNNDFLSGFELRQEFIENNGEDFWNTTAINNAEYGFIFRKWEGDQESFSHYADRYVIIHDLSIEEPLFLQGFASRYLEELMDESLHFEVTWNVADWGCSIGESLVLGDDGHGARGIFLLAEDPLYLSEAYPWIYPQAASNVEIGDSIVFAWHLKVEEELSLAEWTTPWWYEEVFSEFEFQDVAPSTIATLINDQLDIFISDLWDNHWTVDESFDLIISYLFSGHELLSEYLHSSIEAKTGYGADIYDELIIEEDHFGGHWVELISPNLHFDDSILTQQWRHVWFMGVVISSWQIDPIEDRDGDYSRVGELDPGIHGA